jgi:hypothetical protein
MALNATALYTTEPVAQQVARKAAGEELTKFTNIFRAEVGKDPSKTKGRCNVNGKVQTVEYRLMGCLQSTETSQPL